MKRTIIFLFVFFLAPSVAFGQSLDQAYKREVAYLQAQKRSLEKRNAEVKKEGEKKIAGLRANVNGLQTRWLGLQAESEALQERLNELNINTPTKDEQTDALVGTYEQARQSLGTVGHELVERETVTGEDLKQLFALGVVAIDAGRQVSSAQGKYFDLSGTSRTGEIKRVGRIAAFADGQPLAPAGEGRLKIWPQNELPAGVVLFENVEKPLATPTEETTAEMLEAGGTIAYIIVVLGFLALLLAIARIFLLGKHSAPMTFSEELSKVDTRDAAEKIAKNGRGLPAAAVRTLLGRENATSDDLDEIVSGMAPRVERFSTLLMVIAAIAPLLGLLGTVTGMIATFDIITEFGTGDPKLLSGGISEALITTKLGLIVAIPALILGNVLRAWGERIIDELEHSLLIVAKFIGDAPEKAPENLDLAKAVVITQGGGRFERAVS